MDGARSGKQPFFAYIPLNAAHGPHVVPGEYYKQYLGKPGVQEGTAKFLGMVENIDTNFGVLLRQIESNDGVLHLAKVGSYRPNSWGLYDTHGNVAEWTRSDYKPYPYNDAGGRNAGGEGLKVVRGGSWHDRPFRATSTYRLGYSAWQQVYNTGFRVIVE